MKTLVIISDTHNMGMSGMPARVLNAMDEADYILHLGDGEADILSLKRSYGGKVIAVRGNNDASGEKEQIAHPVGQNVQGTQVQIQMEKYIAPGNFGQATIGTAHGTTSSGRATQM